MSPAPRPSAPLPCVSFWLDLCVAVPYYTALRQLYTFLSLEPATVITMQNKCHTVHYYEQEYTKHQMYTVVRYSTVYIQSAWHGIVCTARYCLPVRLGGAHQGPPSAGHFACHGAESGLGGRRFLPVTWSDAAGTHPRAHCRTARLEGVSDPTDFSAWCLRGARDASCLDGRPVLSSRGGKRERGAKIRSGAGRGGGAPGLWCA